MGGIVNPVSGGGTPSNPFVLEALPSQVATFSSAGLVSQNPSNGDTSIHYSDQIRVINGVNSSSMYSSAVQVRSGTFTNGTVTATSFNLTDPSGFGMLLQLQSLQFNDGSGNTIAYGSVLYPAPSGAPTAAGSVQFFINGVSYYIPYYTA